MLEGVDNLDMEADVKYQPLYDQLFVEEYPYVQKIRKNLSRSFESLMKIFPDLAPVCSVEETVASVEPSSAASEPIDKTLESLAIGSSVEKPSTQDSLAPNASAFV